MYCSSWAVHGRVRNEAVNRSQLRSRCLSQLGPNRTGDVERSRPDDSTYLKISAVVHAGKGICEATLSQKNRTRASYPLPEARKNSRCSASSTGRRCRCHKGIQKSAGIIRVNAVDDFLSPGQRVRVFGGPDSTRSY